LSGEGDVALDLTHRLAVARGDRPADLVVKGGRVVSVFTGELFATASKVCRGKQGERMRSLG
jgi:adenine deaminase